MEDSPAYPSFGDKGQERGRILYNEVGAENIFRATPILTFGRGFLSATEVMTSETLRRSSPLVTDCRILLSTIRP